MNESRDRLMDALLTQHLGEQDGVDVIGVFVERRAVGPFRRQRTLRQGRCDAARVGEIESVPVPEPVLHGRRVRQLFDRVPEIGSAVGRAGRAPVDESDADLERCADTRHPSGFVESYRPQRPYEGRQRRLSDTNRGDRRRLAQRHPHATQIGRAHV